jgi:hypothetical protein
MSSRKWQSNTVPDLIIEVWEKLGCESVGRRELEEIQKALLERFGAGAVNSPAAIARAVADEGAALRHPEIFECDYAWRVKTLAEQSKVGQLNFSSLSDALASFGKVEQKRLAIGSDANEIKLLREVVSMAKQEAQLAADSRVLSDAQRQEAREIVEWIIVWLRSPPLFADWLDLRMRTSEFRIKFKRE